MKKIKNSTLLIIFCILALVSAAVYFYDRNKGERTFKSELFTIDSAGVSSIKIYAKGNTGEMVVLERAGKNWNVKVKDKNYEADTSVVRQLISAVRNAMPERVAGTDPSAWHDLEMDDSASTRVVMEQGNEIVADFRVGKISFSQGNQNPGYGGRQNMSVKSHIRIAGDDKVYVVDGFLSMMFRDQPSAYRNRNICRLNISLVNKMTFVYPGDSSFVLQRQGNKWFTGDKPADSAKAETFVQSLANLANSEFADDASIPVTYPFILKIEGNNMTAIEIKGSIDPVSNRYFVHSTFNPGAVFSSASPSLFNQVFPGKKRF
jgi:hypothetical protein